MAAKNFNTFNAVLIILIILGAAGAVGISYYGLKETPSVPGTSQTNNPAETPTAISQNSAYQGASPSVEIVWPTNQALNMENPSVSSPATPLPSSPVSSPLSQTSGAAGNQVLDTYLKAYQETQRNKEPYKEVSFKATIYSSLPLRDFLNGLDIKISSAIYYNLDQKNYRAVFCYRDQNTVDRGLIFRVKRGSSIDDLTQIYGQVTAGLASWGLGSFTDLENIFYPQSVINSKTVPVFQETDYLTKPGVWRDPIRYANIKDQSGKNLFFGYSYVLESIFTANSMDCLKRILDACAPQPD